MYPRNKVIRPLDREARAGLFRNRFARDAARSPNTSDDAQAPSRLLRRADCAGRRSAPAELPPVSVSGVVRDSAGVPQIGAVVQLLRPDLSVLAVVYTDGKGQFSIASVVPGRYAVKAMGTSFLPSLRENVRVRADTVVNLTLNTLYEVMQWLPAQPRAADAQQRRLGVDAALRGEPSACCAGLKMVRWLSFPMAPVLGPSSRRV